MCGTGCCARAAGRRARARQERQNRSPSRWAHRPFLLHDFFRRPPIFTPSAAEGVTRASRPSGWGSLAVGIDAQQLVHAGDQVAGIDGPVLHLFALGIGSAHDVAALESAAGHHGAKRRRRNGRGRRSRALPTAPWACGRTRRSTRRWCVSSSPRSDRSWSRVARPLSISGSFCRITWKFCFVGVPAFDS